MLVEFTVGNYRSFKEPVTFSMVAANLKAKNQELDQNNVFEIEKQPALLTSAALYGANASGKSNLVAALNIMRDLALYSAIGTERMGGIAVEPFRLNTKTRTQPSHFEIIFIAGGKRYRYGFEVTRDRVEAEWLYFVPSTREAKLFERERDNISIGETYFREGKDLEGRTRPNALFLTVVAQFDGHIAQTVAEWFRRLTISFHRDDEALLFYTIQKLLNDQQTAQIRGFVQRLNLDIENFQVVSRSGESPLNNGKKMFSRATERRAVALRQLPLVYMGDEEGDLTIETSHRIFNERGEVEEYDLFDLDVHESAGTQKLIALAGSLVDALANGQVLVIDELDGSLHSLLTYEIIKLFNNPIANPHHAQLIFTTHDTNLLDNQLLRRDQIWFVEKDRQGMSELYSLAEFKVRNDKAYERGYIQGRYGAIPYLGNLEMIAGEVDAAQS